MRRWARLARSFALNERGISAGVCRQALFAIAAKYGNHIRAGWRNIVDCILRLHKLGLLPTKVCEALSRRRPRTDLQPSLPIHGRTQSRQNAWSRNLRGCMHESRARNCVSQPLGL